MSEFDPLVVRDEGYLVAQNDLSDRGAMFERAPILTVVRRLEQFAFGTEERSEPVAAAETE